MKFIVDIKNLINQGAHMMPRVLFLFSTNISFMRFVLSLRVKFANEVEQALSIRKLEHV